jgi:hypothetical protein
MLSTPTRAQPDAAKPTGKKELGPLVYHCSPYLASVDGVSILPDSDGRRYVNHSSPRIGRRTL